ncbi:MAG TPA: hypothetical protein PL124_05360 [Candidatus Cloacimonadota bacterium]|nr:hypothetical protein [Candidatus Cloacimonadota bacterium]HPS38824.1 hypothetical protein [Candidatus Cloacimonadota bacterium]
MEIKTKIKTWLDSGQDYQEGLELLHEVGIKKHKVFGKLSKGESKTRHEKLAYLLSKELGLREVPAPRKIVKKQPATKPVLEKPKKETEKSPEESGKEPESRYNLIGKDEDINDYPGEIKGIIIEYSNLYKERSITQKELLESGNSNEAAIVTKRAEIVSKISSNSERMEELYKAFRDFKETGKIPGGKESDENVEVKSIEELKRLKKNLQASIVKDKNQLLYKTKTKPSSGKESPMPDGPRRFRLEKRVKQKEAEIERLDMEIAKLE